MKTTQVLTIRRSLTTACLTLKALEQRERALFHRLSETAQESPSGQKLFDRAEELNTAALLIEDALIPLNRTIGTGR